MDWDRVETLAERAPSPADVHFHRLETFLARRLRARDEPVPPYLEEAERAAALTTMSAAALLDRIRAAYGGPLLLVKGPEVAAHYPERVLRPFGDLDLITPDAQLVQEALLRAGFEPLSDEPDQPELHHRPPLVAPGFHSSSRSTLGRSGQAGRRRRRQRSCSCSACPPGPTPRCRHCRPRRTRCCWQRTPGPISRSAGSSTSSTSRPWRRRPIQRCSTARPTVARRGDLAGNHRGRRSSPRR